MMVAFVCLMATLSGGWSADLYCVSRSGKPALVWALDKPELFPLHRGS